MEPIKQFTGNLWAKITFVFLSLFLSAQSFAAQRGLDVDIHTDKGSGGAWYTSWYVWAAAALFILALVAIVSAGRRRV